MRCHGESTAPRSVEFDLLEFVHTVGIIGGICDMSYRPDSAMVPRRPKAGGGRP